MKVLVVDDMASVRKMNSRAIIDLCGQDNVEILQAKDALEALEILEQEEVVFDLIVTDYEMGGKEKNNTTDLNGTHLIKTLFAKNYSSKIILVSSFDQDDFSELFSDIDNASFIDNSFTTQDGEVIFDFCQKEGNIIDKLKYQIKKDFPEYFNSIASSKGQKEYDGELVGAEIPNTIVKSDRSFCRNLCTSILSCFSK